MTDYKAQQDNTYKDHLYGLILAGGGGTRLWPKSLEETPKQFLKLFGNKTLTEITAERLLTFLPPEKIFVITTTPAYGETIRKLLPYVPKNQIIVEPMRRDSGPAHALGALYISQKDKEAVIINAASDHFVSPVRFYKHTMYAAANTAFRNHTLVAVGIRPTYPHTGMGHLKKGKRLELSGGKTVYKLDKFVEKPPLPLAKKYTESGDYFWNANHYVWRADAFLDAIKLYAHDIYKGIQTISKSLGTKKEAVAIKESYEGMPKISVDYAVSEKAKNLTMLIADYNWTDIGDWNEVWKNLSKDDFGNVVIDGQEPGGEVIYLDTTDTLIQTDGRMIAVIDVDNIVVIDTPKALLICNKGRAQNVKKIVERLKEENRTDLL